jgi:hypothetical protein
LRIEVSHEEHAEIHREVERQTHKPCAEGIHDLTEAEFLAIVRRIKGKTKPLLAEILA